jgi:hypothetical protein
MTQIMDNLPQQYNAGLGDVISALLTLRGTTTKWIAGKGWHDTDGLPVPKVMLLINTDTLLKSWYPDYKGNTRHTQQTTARRGCVELGHPGVGAAHRLRQ